MMVYGMYDTFDHFITDLMDFAKLYDIIITNRKQLMQCIFLYTIIPTIRLLFYMLLYDVFYKFFMDLPT